ncbi:MAG: VOC family protein [Pyrinomonadaceae bacterium]|nr:VOC family protein [Pyrinomonadaceae bacterium]
MNLNQVTIYSDKTNETVEFYERLGLKRIVDSLPRYARLECPDGDSTLSVHEAETRAAGSVPSSNDITLYFECEDLDAEYECLTALGLEFTEPPTDRPWLWREAYTNDPNGNRICLYHAGQNRLDPPWKLGR